MDKYKGIRWDVVYAVCSVIRLHVVLVITRTVLQSEWEHIVWQ